MIQGRGQAFDATGPYAAKETQACSQPLNTGATFWELVFGAIASRMLERGAQA